MNPDKPKFNITPKQETSGLPVESIAEVFHFEGKRIPFIRQNTMANCGPLAIVNGINALKNINTKVSIPTDFPSSPQKVRDIFSQDERLRQSYQGAESSDEIKKNSYPLKGEHMVNLLKELTSESNLQLVIDRFANSVFISPENMPETIRSADWLLLAQNFHYTSYVKLDEEMWLHLDSMSSKPAEISLDQLQLILRDELPKKMPLFVGLKIDEKPKIVFTRKK